MFLPTAAFGAHSGDDDVFGISSQAFLHSSKGRHTAIENEKFPYQGCFGISLGEIAIACEKFPCSSNDHLITVMERDGHYVNHQEQQASSADTVLDDRAGRATKHDSHNSTRTFLLKEV